MNRLGERRVGADPKVGEAYEGRRGEMSKLVTRREVTVVEGGKVRWTNNQNGTRGECWIENFSRWAERKVTT